MKKIALGIGIALILLLTAIWVYLMFFSTSNGEGGTFGIFDFGDTTDTSVSINDVPLVTVDEPVVDIYSPEALRQLTTRPTIGHQEVFLTPSSTPIIYFAEAGTGHIYSIDIVSGEEERLSNITVPVASNAAISKNGMYAAIQSGEGVNSEVTLITLPTSNSSLSSDTLADKTDNFDFTEAGNLMYSTKSTNATIARLYDSETKISELLFEVPFREAVIVWGENREDSHLIYPKPTQRLQGYLYEASRSTISRLPISGYGLSAVGNTDHIIYSKQENGTYSSYFYNRNNSTHTKLSDSTIPHKCLIEKIGSTYNYAVCAISNLGSNQPDEWMMGKTTSVDAIYSLDTGSGEASLEIDTFSETARNIDIVDIVSVDDGFIFTNRLDNTLWMYDFTN